MNIIKSYNNFNIEEYEKVKNLKYNEYCDYLVNKYGKCKDDYFDKDFKKNRNISRTKEGLICHHKCENIITGLSNPTIAKEYSFEYQLANNIIYCNYLEHLYLHILISELPGNFGNMNYIQGIIKYITSELNDWYSGFVPYKVIDPETKKITGESWKLQCRKVIIKDKDVYLTLLKRLKNNFKNYYESIGYIFLNKNFSGNLCTSFNSIENSLIKKNNKSNSENMDKEFYKYYGYTRESVGLNFKSGDELYEKERLVYNWDYRNNFPLYREIFDL